MKPTLTKERYAIERAIVDKAEAYRQRVTGGKRNYLTAEETAHPDYSACNNEMRGRVEQYEILTDPPEKFVAYIGEGNKNGMGCDRIVGQSYPVTTWAGTKLGIATKGASWRVYSRWGTHMHQFYARITGREYTGRGFGPGMSIVLRETAESKRARAKQ